MSQQIDETQVRKVAQLARLELSPEEIQAFTGQLEAILEYVNKLNELDTSDVEPLAHCLPVHNRLREDVVQPCLSNDEALANAPERDGEFFKVPKILDDNSGA